METISMRLKMSFIVCLIAFPIVIMVTLIYQNSSFGLFERFSKDMTMGETNQKNVTIKSIGESNVTTIDFGLKQNVTHDNIGGGRNESVTKFKRSQNISLKNSTNDSTSTPHDNIGGRNESDIKFKRSQNISMKNSTNDSTSTPPKDIINEKEKLLDGLLASGFSAASCISRSQSHLYHKPSPHKPSPYLISKLRKYEKLHRRCNPNTRAYNKDMKNIANSMNNSTSSVATTCNYIIWLPANGLGNQIISMASSFLYALLTDRILLVQFGKDKDGLFCEPFLNSTWLLPDNSPFRDAENVIEYQSIIEMEMHNTLNEDLPSAMYVDLKYSPSNDERFFHCDHSQYLLSKIPLLFLEAGQYFVPSFFMTPYFNNELNKMFPEITSIFHHLGRYLFHPSNEAWKLITSFYEENLAKADERVGLQIRVFDPNSTPQQVVMNQILNCTLENKLLPKVLGMKNNISMSNSSGKNKTIKKVVLVASLYPQYGENLRNMYMNKSTITGEVIEVYQPSGEVEQRFNDNKHDMKAWVEMYLLSLSDVLVTTYRSTFGYVAKALGNSRPWILYDPMNSKEICEEEFTLEPCYHYPPLHYCDGKAIKDVSSSFPYIRHCKDYPFGLKLVNASI